LKKRIFIILAIIIGLGVVIGGSLVSSNSGGFDVDVEACERGDVTPTVTAEGLISAKVTVNISSQVMGEVVRIPFKEGDAVRKGDVLVELNQDTYLRDVASSQANLLALEAALRQARVTLSQRERDWERAQDLYDQKIYSDQQRDDVRLALDAARASADQTAAQVQQAGAALRRSEDYLKKTVLRSPVDGVVTAVHVKEGEQAMIGTMNNPGTVLLTVSDLSEIITEVQVDEVDFPRLRLGQGAEVLVEALEGRKYTGQVVEIGASAQAGSGGVQNNIRQFKVKVALDAPDEDLRPGVTARVKLIGEKAEDVLFVPISAIRSEEEDDETTHFVFLADAGKAVKQVIETGLSDNLNTEVVSGLEEGSRVITGPYRTLRTLRDADRIKVKRKGGKDGKKGGRRTPDEGEAREAGESENHE